MSDWLKKINMNEDIILAGVQSIDVLSEAFHQVGNEKVGLKLNRIAISIESAMKEINEAIKNHIHEEYKQAQESSANVFKATLAGIEISKKENKS